MEDGQREFNVPDCLRKAVLVEELTLNADEAL